MTPPSTPSSTPKPMVWAGWVLTGLIVLFLAYGGIMALTKSPDVVSQFGKFGYTDERAITGIGIALLVSVLLYALPPTSVLGAVLLTGYLGGAVATHVIAHDPFFAPIIAGVLVWLALFLRDARLRALLPVRRTY